MPLRFSCYSTNSQMGGLSLLGERFGHKTRVRCVETQKVYFNYACVNGGVAATA